MTDPYFNQVQLLIGCDSGTIVDESPAGRTLTTIGSASASTNQPKFGTHALRFPTAGTNNVDGVTVPDDPTLELGDGAWTIEGWFYFGELETTSNFAQYLLSKADTFFSALPSWTLRYWAIGAPLRHQFDFLMVDGEGDSLGLTSTDLITVDTYHFVAVSCDGETARMYVDGALVASDTKTNNNFGTMLNNSYPLSIGCELSNGGPANGVTNGYIDEVRITIGTARYTGASMVVPTAAFPREGPPAEVYEDVLTDGVDIFSLAGEFTNNILWHNETNSFSVTVDPPEANRLANGTLSDTVRAFLHIADSKGYPVTESDVINLTPALVGVRGVVISEIVQLVQQQVVSGAYGKTLVDTARLSDLVTRAMTGSLADTTSFAHTLDVVLGAVVIEQLNLTPTVLGSALYGRSLADTARFADALGRFLGMEVADGLTLTAALAQLHKSFPTLTDQTVLTDTLASTMLLSVVAADEVEITAAELLGMIYNQQVAEGIEITGGLVNPGGGLLTWTMNTRTTAVTEYDNFDYNSFVQMGAKYIGANSTGLYELNGDTDDGDPIIARMRGGYMQFGGTKLSRLKAAYIAARGEGDFVLKIETGDGATYSYAVSTRDMRSTKVHMGKGQRARYFAFELISAGQDFDLDTLEFVPVVVRRRV